MKKHLKKITDVTINDLLNKDVIMPSIYFEKFNKNAKTIDINIQDSSFEKELNKILIEDFNSIEMYMNTIEKNASIMKKSIKSTQTALLNKDIDTLTDVYSQILKLEKEIKTLNKHLFVDDVTSSSNRKWIYNKFLNKEAQFKKDGICVLIDIIDFEYIDSEYGTLLANNLLIFINNFIKENLKEEKIDFKIARFFDSQFVIFIEDKKEKEISNLIFNIKQLLKNTTLKSKAGLEIRADYKYSINKYRTNEESKEIFEQLFHEIKEE
jgi:GGDEF domain-containing protein